eukprot:263083_1
MSNTQRTKLSITITKPTYEHPFLHITGNGTYALRSKLCNEFHFYWKPDKKIWEKKFHIFVGMTTFDLQKAASKIIDQITEEACFEGIKVNLNDNNTNNTSHYNTKPSTIDYKLITNISKTYPDGKKLPNISKTKYYKDKFESKPDIITATLNILDNTIELRGSTYYNRNWLKSTLKCQWDTQKKVWYISNANHNILAQIKRILNEFGVSKTQPPKRIPKPPKRIPKKSKRIPKQPKPIPKQHNINYINYPILTLTQEIKRKKENPMPIRFRGPIPVHMPMINHMPIPMLTHIPVPVLMNIKPVKKLKRKTMSESSDDEIEILHKPPPPALKRRRITYHTLDINIESDNHNNKSESYSDDDNVIEYM